MKVAGSVVKARGRHSADTRRVKKKRKKQLLVHQAAASNSDPRNMSPDTTLARRYQQLTGKGQSGLKRLQNSVRPVDSCREPGPSREATHYRHTNGGSQDDPELSGDMEDVEDAEDWGAIALSLLQNGAGSPQNIQPDGQEEEPLQVRAEIDPVHNWTVVLLQQGQSLAFRGRCLLTCLYGRVEVLGFTIEEGQQPYPVFSPPTNCPLTITAVGNSSASGKTKKERRMEAKAIIRNYLSTEARKRLQSEVDSESCLVLLQPLDTPMMRFIASLPEHRNLFELSSRELMLEPTPSDCPLSPIGVIPLRGRGSGLVTSQSYRNALTNLINACAEEADGCPVILVCGAKNTGKSTFNRHLINSLLNHTTSVDYLECDLGQTEFTPPGCLSLSSVTEPLLGPPFTHQRTPEHMVFYGESSCERDLDRYLDSLRLLWSSYSREVPVIINTMGWVKGFGFQLLVDLIRLFSVTHVVQFSYGSTTQCPALTPSFLQSAHGWQTRPPAPPALGHESEEHIAPQGHILLSVQSDFERTGSVGNTFYGRTNVIRELALLGYLGQLQPSEGPVRPLHCFTPYQVPMSAVAVRVIHCEVAPAHVLYVANGSLVGLCCLGEKVGGTGGPVLLSQTPVCQCVGFGVVRGVDVTRGLYLLVTPVAPSILRQVNCFLVGGVTLPHSLLRAQPGVQGDKPYVTTDYSFELSGAGKMRVFRGLQRREHQGGGGH